MKRKKNLISKTLYLFVKLVIVAIMFSIFFRILSLIVLTFCYYQTASLGSRRCQRTLKYFQAVAHHKWLVSVDWVINSVKRNRLLPVVSELFQASDTVFLPGNRLVDVSTTIYLCRLLFQMRFDDGA